MRYGPRRRRCSPFNPENGGFPPSLAGNFQHAGDGAALRPLNRAARDFGDRAIEPQALGGIEGAPGANAPAIEEVSPQRASRPWPSGRTPAISAINELPVRCQMALDRCAKTTSGRNRIVSCGNQASIRAGADREPPRHARFWFPRVKRVVFRPPPCLSVRRRGRRRRRNRVKASRRSRLPRC